MPLSDPWLPSSGPPNRPAIAVQVYRQGLGPISYTLLDNLDCLMVESKAGAAPSVAHFRYVFGNGDVNAPGSIEQALDTATVLPRTVLPGDRLAVRATEPWGSTAWIFCGYALAFGLRYGPREEHADVTALGVEVRCRDSVLGGMVLRDGADPAAGPDVATDLVARFNPRGRPNCIGEGHRAITSGPAALLYPTFLDDEIVRDPDVRYPWTLPRAARYLCGVGNDAEDFVANPAGADLDAVLVGREPIGGGTAFDPANPATYTAADITCPDTTVTGKDWAGALERLIGAHGFQMRWDLDSDGSGDPRTTLAVYHPQAGPAKDLWLQARGSAVDTLASNLGSASLDRDLGEVANRWVVQGAPVRYEASFVLACGFPSTSTDASAANLAHWTTAGVAADATRRNTYRLWVFDETGEGHYAAASTTKLTTVPSLDSVLGAPVSGVARHAKRRRGPIGDLISVDLAGRPLRHSLAYSTDYAGNSPHVWASTDPFPGTWTTIHGGYQLLPDRLGIWVSVQDPNAWAIGKDASNRPKVLKAVQAIAAADTANPVFYLRLTCVIEADQLVSGTAARRTASPLPWDVTRAVDARDRYRREVVKAGSEHNSTLSDSTARDDSDDAQAEAEAIRDAQDSGILGGEVTITNLTLYYSVGDRIASINGRGLSFRTDGGGPDNAPIYPVVVGRKLDPIQQTTTLTLSDARSHGNRGQVS